VNFIHLFKEFIMSEITEIVRTGLQNLDEKYQAKFAEMQASMIDMAQHQGGHKGAMGGQGDVLGKALADERIKAFQADRGVKSASVTINASLDGLLRKSTIVGDAASSTADLYSVQPQRDGRLGENPQRPLTIMDALPRLPVSSNTLEFNQLDGYTNLAAIQSAEGADLGQTAAPTDLKSVKIATIGHYLKMSEQVAADVPLLRQQMDSLIRYGVMAKASAEIIAGTGSVIEGLQEQASSFVAASDSTIADGIGQAATSLQVAGWQPNVVMMHPNLWQAIRAERSLTENLYIAGNWAMPAPMTMWGMTVVLDPSVSQAVPMVLDASQVAILDRQEARVELGRSGTDFTDATVTLRAMIRVGLAVFSPSALVQVTIAT